MTRNEQVVAAAMACVGASFRLHGRDPATGLDCVGVAAWALRQAGWQGVVPSGYAMRGGSVSGVTDRLDRQLTRADSGGRGVVLLFATGPGQLHLAIGTGGGIVHADASLRRVVMRPGPPPWPVIAAWTMREG